MRIGILSRGGDVWSTDAAIGQPLDSDLYKMADVLAELPE
jgi:hypothetical protein